MNKKQIKASSVDVMVGLPHLGKGALLRRLEELGQPALISANALSRWSMARGWREWRGWKWSMLGNARGLTSLSLDSAGFTAMATYGGYPWTIADYVQLAAAFPFRWWAALDYCVEPEIATDREEVLDRISRTIRANIECRLHGEDAGIAANFLPVIQGRLPQDYERCAEALSLTIERAAIIGVGSMCRRSIHGADGLISVVDHLDRVLPRGVQLHLFGVKGEAIPFLMPFAHRVASLDSQAYGVGARVAARRQGKSKTDQFVAEHMTTWLVRQQERFLRPARYLPVQAPAALPPVPVDPWARAIMRARSETRDLIASGDLDHDQPVTPWIEQWAADLLEEEGQRCRPIS